MCLVVLFWFTRLKLRKAAFSVIVISDYCLLDASHTWSHLICSVIIRSILHIKKRQVSERLSNLPEVTKLLKVKVVFKSRILEFSQKPRLLALSQNAMPRQYQQHL